MSRTISRRKFLETTSTLTAGAILASCAPSITSRPKFDLIIKNGAVIDGTGAAEFSADIGVRDGIIQAVEKLDTLDAARIIDAAGLKVVPGFIDIHSHTDGSVLYNPTADSKLRQGVTTEVGGQDGDSLAPMSDEAYQRCISKRDPKDCPFKTFDEVFSAIEKRGSAQNMVSFVGLGSVREKIVGEDDRPATKEEMELMKREMLAAIEQGCVGASTGLEYTPGSFATADELAEIMKVIPEPYRLYASHMRNEDNFLLEAIDEAIRIARNSGSRLQVSHLKAQYKVNWYKQELALRMLEEALAEGIETHTDRYPYIAYSTGLANLFPLWSRDGGTEKFMALKR